MNETSLPADEEEINPSELVPFDEDFPFFIDAGLLAIKQGDEINARRCLQAAQVIRPQHSAPRLCNGLIALNKLQLPEAERIFTSLIEERPDHALAQALLALTLLLTSGKEQEGVQRLTRLLEESEEPDVKQLAQNSLDWYAKRNTQQKSRRSFSV